MNDWKKRAIAAYEECKAAETEIERAYHARRAAELRTKLGSLGIDAEPEGDSVNVDGVQFVLARDPEFELRNCLYVVRRCEACGDCIRSHPIRGIIDLGRALAGEHWSCHDCEPEPSDPADGDQDQNLSTAEVLLAAFRQWHRELHEAMEVE